MLSKRLRENDDIVQVDKGMPPLEKEQNDVQYSLEPTWDFL